MLELILKLKMIKKNFLKLKLLFPELDIENFNKKFDEKKFFLY